METVSESTSNHNEVLHAFLRVESGKTPQEILEMFRSTTPQMPPALFLQRLPGGNTVIQFFDDTPAKNMRKADWTVTFDQAIAQKKQSNGCGVFFSVNAFNGRRRKECVALLRAFYIDWDAAKQGGVQSQEEIDAAKVAMLKRLLLLEGPFLPHVIIETRNGLHVLWFIDNGDRAITVPEYERAMERLIEHFGADPGAKDVTRVLRLPGFLHLKDPASPFPVSFLYLDL